MLINRELPEGDIASAAKHLGECLRLDGHDVTVHYAEEVINVHIHKDKYSAVDCIPPKWRGFRVFWTFKSPKRGHKMWHNKQK